MIKRDIFPTKKCPDTFGVCCCWWIFFPMIAMSFFFKSHFPTQCNCYSKFIQVRADTSTMKYITEIFFLLINHFLNESLHLSILCKIPMKFDFFPSYQFLIFLNTRFFYVFVSSFNVHKIILIWWIRFIMAQYFDVHLSFCIVLFSSFEFPVSAIQRWK